MLKDQTLKKTRTLLFPDSLVWALQSWLSEVSKRGWRAEAVVTRKSLPHHKFRPFFCPLFPMLPYRTVSEYCSTRASRVGLSTEQATEPYSDNLLNHTRNLSEPYSDKEIPLRRPLRRFAFLVGLSTGNPPKIGTFAAWNRTRNHTRTPSDLMQENTILGDIFLLHLG